MEYPMKDWQYEVANGDTVLGFEEWKEHKDEANGMGFKLTGVNAHVRARQRIEQTIARKVVDVLLAAGFFLGVYDGEDIPVHHSTNRADILKALFNTDEDYLYIYKQGKGNRVRPDHWVYFVYGNDGWDVISNYSSTEDLDPYLGDGTEVQALIDKYSG